MSTYPMLALDPGLNHAGLALFDDEQIFEYIWTINPTTGRKDAAGWLDISDLILDELYKYRFNSGAWGKLAYEMPQLIGGWQKGDQNAILQVAGAAGTIVARIDAMWELVEAPVAVRPSQWTGSRPKKANHLRMWRRLTMYEQEKLAVCCKMSSDTLFECIRHGDEAELEHALDAVCIGLYALGRWA